MSQISIFPSPNYNDRPAFRKPELIILHYTGMNPVEAALTRLCDPESKVSAHYLVEKNGKIHQLVDEAKRAWHAGLSFWQGETDINGISLGIEIDNGGHDFGLPTYPTIQIDMLLCLIKELIQKYNIPKDKIIGHSDIAPTRKIDPGEHFPWLTLHKHGFGMWPEIAPIRPQPQSVLDAQHILASIGYECPLTGILDPQTMAVIEAFQRHFTPHEITGTFTLHLQYILSCFRFP